MPALITVRAHAFSNPAVERPAAPYPAALKAILSEYGLEDARREITVWPGYAPTPLRWLDGLARAAGLHALWYRGESERFGLSSSKRWAVLTLLSAC